MNINSKNITCFLILIISFFVTFQDLHANFKYSKKNKIKLIQNKKNDLTYKLIIDGVECKICARKAVNILEAIEGISKAEFICLNKNFDDCYAIVYLKDKNTNIDIKKIEKELKKENFVLKNLTGEFLGQFIQDKENKYFQPLESDYKFKVKTNEKNLSSNQKVVLVKANMELVNNDYLFTITNLKQLQ